METGTLRVFNVFPSISGESGYFPQGSFVTFLRLAGCDLRCSWCDTPDALPRSSGEDWKIEQVIQTVKLQSEYIKSKNILVTGGEPLLQQEGLATVIQTMTKQGYSFQIETGGHIAPTKQLNDSACLAWVVDYKLPDSRMNKQMLDVSDYVTCFDGQVYMKFVISSKQDYECAKQVVFEISSLMSALSPPLRERCHYPTFLFSPNLSSFSPVELFCQMQMDFLTGRNVILNCQIHQLLGIGKIEEKKLVSFDTNSV